VAVAALVLVVIALTLTLAVVLARGHRREPDAPDGTSAAVMSDVLAELRKWQAEAAHWKATAERLQRELDQRG